MSLERCTECERIVDTDMETGKYIEDLRPVWNGDGLELVTEFYCDTCAEKLELNDESSGSL